MTWRFSRANQVVDTTVETLEKTRTGGVWAVVLTLHPPCPDAACHRCEEGE